MTKSSANHFYTPSFINISLHFCLPSLPIHPPSPCPRSGSSPRGWTSRRRHAVQPSPRCTGLAQTTRRCGISHPSSAGTTTAGTRRRGPTRQSLAHNGSRHIPRHGVAAVLPNPPVCTRPLPCTLSSKPHGTHMLNYASVSISVVDRDRW
jgi:hypothetical protein